MQISIQVSKILQEQRIDRRGIVEELAKVLGLHRHSVSKILNDTATSISMETLCKLCEWLHKKTKVAPEELLRQIFAVRAPELWKAVNNTKRITLYLGEYRQINRAGGEETVGLWVSRRDSAATNAITEQLYTLHDQNTAPRLQSVLCTKYVPFRFDATSRTGRREYFEEDTKRAIAMFKEMRNGSANSASILIGSQEVNGLVEVVVADLFGCTPFVSTKGDSRVPFHLVFRSRHYDIASCFGSYKPPQKFVGEAKPGIYYLNEHSKWVALPWVRDCRDAGVVIIRNNRSTKSLEMVLFGFSGRATAAMASVLIPSSHYIWPPYCEQKTEDIGVYICNFNLDPGLAAAAGTVDEPAQNTALEVIPLDKTILSERLKRS